jgi:hypothetical protein
MDHFAVAGGIEGIEHADIAADEFSEIAGD